jgi:hypothetical protein
LLLWEDFSPHRLQKINTWYHNPKKSNMSPKTQNLPNEEKTTKTHSNRNYISYHDYQKEKKTHTLENFTNDKPNATPARPLDFDPEADFNPEADFDTEKSAYRSLKRPEDLPNDLPNEEETFIYTNIWD